MPRVVVSEFHLKTLDRAARFAGEVFGSEEAMGHGDAGGRRINSTSVLWVACAAIAFCGLLLLAI